MDDVVKITFIVPDGKKLSIRVGGNRYETFEPGSHDISLDDETGHLIMELVGTEEEV